MPIRRLAPALIAVSAILAAAGGLGARDVGDERYWPQWRGPHATGVSKTANPPDRVERDEEHPLEDRDSRAAARHRRSSGAIACCADRRAGRRRRGAAHGARRPRPRSPHKFVVMALDRKTGKVVWEQTAREEAPHEGAHQQFGTFASTLRGHRRRARLRLLRLVGALRLRHERQAGLGEGSRRQEDAQRVRRGADAGAASATARRPVGSPGPVVHRRARQDDGQGALARDARRDRQLGHAARRRARRKAAGHRQRR